MSMTLQGRASTIRLTSVTLSRQQFSQEESNRYRVFKCDFKGVDQLKSADVMSMP